MRSSLATWPATLLLLASCVVGPDYRSPTPLAAGAATPLVEAKSPLFSPTQPAADWWRLFEAPELDALVNKALAHNTDLRTALASLQAAQAQLRVIQAERTPQTELVAGITEGRTSVDDRSAPGPVFTFAETVTYDVDLFGRLARGVEASRADVEAARAALDLARVNVAAAVAGAYATACSAGYQIAVADRSIELAEQIVSVTERRVRGGVAGANDVVRARAVLLQTEAQRPGLLARQRAALHLLATLTGDPPEAVPATVATCATPPRVMQAIPVGDGMSLLRRRPDVRQAERRLAASVARIGVATSELYPTVTLGGQLGFSDRIFLGSIGPTLSWSFPNTAIARAKIAQANAVAKGDLAGFDGTVLTALRETETALSALARQVETERALQDARNQAARGAENSERLYRGGVGAFIDTLDAERSLILADAALADANAQVADRQVQLFLALGGGWQDAPQPVERPLDGVIRAHDRPEEHR